MAIATAVASRNYSVIGVDIDNPQGQKRINSINKGEFPFETSDSKLVKAAKEAFQSGRLTATADESVYADADIVVVDVHLDIKSEKAVMGNFVKAVSTVGKHIKEKTLVLVETTVPPGTCENVVAPALNEEFVKRGLPENSFLLAHSYERVMPGPGYFDSIAEFWRVYSGYNEESAAACEEFLSSIINVDKYPLTRLSKLVESETAKVLENSYRATNIAFINEWSRFSEKVGVNLFDVIGAIKKRPTHNNIMYPGFGVGGYCLTKDPLFPGIASRDIFNLDTTEFPISEIAVKINEHMPLDILSIIKDLSKDLDGKKILVLGVTYRADVADTRYSPSETFAKAAIECGAVIDFHDPMVDYFQEMNSPVCRELPDVSKYDILVFAVSHKCYKEICFADLSINEKMLIVDGNNVLTVEQKDQLKKNYKVISIGEGIYK
jgi:nucleotide sugar dehydrogenase